MDAEHIILLGNCVLQELAVRGVPGKLREDTKVPACRVIAPVAFNGEQGENQDVEGDQEGDEQQAAPHRVNGHGSRKKIPQVGKLRYSNDVDPYLPGTV